LGGGQGGQGGQLGGISGDLSRDSAGVLVARAAVEEALSWALMAANASIVRLNTLEKPENFAGFMDNLESAAQDVLIKHVEDSTKGEGMSGVGVGASAGVGVGVGGVGGGGGGGMSKAVLDLAAKDLSSRIFTRLVPLFKRQVQLLRNEIANDFNDKVCMYVCMYVSQ
jgi:hypothetical protein